MALWHRDEGTVHCRESLGPGRAPWDSWGYGVGTGGSGGVSVGHWVGDQLLELLQLGDDLFRGKCLSWHAISRVLPFPKITR